MIYLLLFLIFITSIWLINLYIPEQCPKEKAGYICRHSNNGKECGRKDD